MSEFEMIFLTTILLLPVGLISLKVINFYDD